MKFVFLSCEKFPDLIPAVSSKGEKYVRSGPNDTSGDKLVNFIPIKVSTLTLILNVILLVVGYIFIGKEFGLKIVLTSLMLPMYLRIFEIVTPNTESPSGNIVIDLACFMVVISLGQALLFYMNASSGGLDVIAKHGAEGAA